MNTPSDWTKEELKANLNANRWMLKGTGKLTVTRTRKFGLLDVALLTVAASIMIAVDKAHSVITGKDNE
jgi:hypothetical protein